jgi:hypothetical protein
MRIHLGVVELPSAQFQFLPGRRPEQQQASAGTLGDQPRPNGLPIDPKLRFNSIFFSRFGPP